MHMPSIHHHSIRQTLTSLPSTGQNLRTRPQSELGYDRRSPTAGRSVHQKSGFTDGACFPSVRLHDATPYMCPQTARSILVLASLPRPTLPLAGLRRKLDIHVASDSPHVNEWLPDSIIEDVFDSNQQASGVGYHETDKLGQVLTGIETFAAFFRLSCQASGVGSRGYRVLSPLHLPGSEVHGPLLKLSATGPFRALCTRVHTAYRTARDGGVNVWPDDPDLA